MLPDLGSVYCKRDKLYEQLTKKNKRFVHPQTINNFLSHVDDIENPDDKNWVLFQLDAYLETCEINLPDINRTFGIRVYNEMLYPLFVYYDDNLQFEKFDFSLFIFYYVIWFGVAFLAFGAKGIVAVLVILIFRSVHFYRKYKEKKVFSLFY